MHDLSKISQILLKNRKLYSLNSFLKRNYPRIYSEITNKTDFLKAYYADSSVPIAARLYCIINGISEMPKCKVCGKPVRFDVVKRRFADWCSISCSASDPDTVKKANDAKANNKSSTKEKMRKTCIEKYGVDSYFKSDEFKNKAKKTFIEKYGVDSASKLKAVIDKVKATKLERYGSSTYNNAAKGKVTKEAKYGNPNYNNRDKFKSTIKSFDNEKKLSILKKREATNIKKFGSAFATQSNEVKRKTKATCLEKYGTDCTLKTDKAIANRNLLLAKKSWALICSDAEYEPMFTFDEFVANKSLTYEFVWRCKNCQEVFSSSWRDGHISKRCPKCKPKPYMVSQTGIYDFIKSIYYGKIITNTKSIISPLELDIYLPDLKIAFEFDGLYWHNDFRKPDGYHLYKTEECAKKGIRLIHIFEDEWAYKKDIVKSRIENILGFNKNVEYARKCTVKELDSDLSRDFFDRTHIQGNANASVCLGLFNKDGKLIAAMSFGRSRFDKSFDYELIRFSVELGWHVPGAASKLLRHFEDNYNPKSIISYCDLRWSQGGLYEKLGFKLIRQSPPNYWYVGPGSYFRESRQKFQKNKLSKVLENYDPSLTEKQNMRNNGYSRIYDCGNLVFARDILGHR